MDAEGGDLETIKALESKLRRQVCTRTLSGHAGELNPTLRTHSLFQEDKVASN